MTDELTNTHESHDPGKMTDVDKQNAKKLVGVWQLEDASTKEVETGRPKSAYGAGAKGFIHYTNSGHMTAIITHGGRRNVDGDRQSCPPEQKIEAYTTSMAYAGRYWVQGDQVIHRVEVATFPNWVGCDLVRYFRMEDNVVTLLTAPQMQDGVLSTIELTWRKCA